MRTVFPAGIATIALVVTACGGGDAAPTAAPTATSAPAALTSTATATPGDKTFELPFPAFPISVYQGEETVGGSEIVFSGLFAQGQPVVLNFWAGLCPPCRAELPDLQEVNDEYKGRILLFGADVGVFTALGSQDDGRALLRELNISFPAGAATTNIVRSSRIFSMPTTLFITPSGEIQKRWNGLLNREKMGELIEELLEASA